MVKQPTDWNEKKKNRSACPLRAKFNFSKTSDRVSRPKVTKLIIEELFNLSWSTNYDDTPCR